MIKVDHFRSAILALRDVPIKVRSPIIFHPIDRLLIRKLSNVPSLISEPTIHLIDALILETTTNSDMPSSEHDTVSELVVLGEKCRGALKRLANTMKFDDLQPGDVSVISAVDQLMKATVCFLICPVLGKLIIFYY